MYKDFTINLFIFFSFLSLSLGLAGCGEKPPVDDGVDTIPFVRLLEHQTFQSKVLNRTINYAVLLPAEYEKSTTPFPVVFLLHGYGESETGWYVGGNAEYYIDQFAAETIPMIYVMPEGFNSYYVNRFNGSFSYMDMFVNELVPHIDSLFHTFKDAQHRAVMGYSMGGYGALILPLKNPTVFKTSVVLSMSFRTDEQYIAEPQSVFNNQWGSVFGGSGKTGDQRITEYFKNYSPFHFLANPGNPSITGVNLFIDCGDDEETLSVTNDALHDALRNLNIPHEFRMHNGAHTWDYWHSAMPEALRYIGIAVRQMHYPSEPDRIYPGPQVPAERIIGEQLTGSNLLFNVMLPSTYTDISLHFPLITILHDRAPGEEVRESQDLYSLLNSNMASYKLPQSLVLEIPMQETAVTKEILQQILEQVKSKYRTTDLKSQSIIAGNNRAGALAWELAPGLIGSVNACLLFDAALPANATAVDPGITYYLDISDKGLNYISYHSLYLSIREHEVPYEYRVRQGTQSHQAFLNGLFDSFLFMKEHLKNTGI
jgi:S-formylglutathione hydrolase FrmB